MENEKWEIRELAPNEDVAACLLAVSELALNEDVAACLLAMSEA